jgi:hypothetical protein
MKHKELIISILLILVSGFAFSQSNKLDNLNPVINDRGLDGLILEYSLNEINSTNQIIDNQTWAHISIPGFTFTQERGKPKLPAQTQIIAIPEGADYSINYSYSETKTYQNVLVHPVLRPATDRYGDPEPEFEIDSVFYQTDSYYPALPYEVLDVQEFRGIQLVYLRITPASYNPLSKEIKLIKDLRITINFNGGSRFIDASEHSPMFLNAFPVHFANSTSIISEIQSQLSSILNPPQAEKNYIIITDTLFIDAANKFANWKRQMGYSVELLASSNWTVADITNAVHDRYHNWSVKPDYLLIIGDHQFVPARIVQNPSNEPFGTDLHYVTMGGQYDFVPEMAKGRLSVSSSSQAMTVVDKIINYEKSPTTDSTFYQTGLNCAQFQDDDNNSYADRRFTHTSEEIRDYVMSKGYDVNRVYYANTSSTIPLYYNGGFYSNGQSLPSDLTASGFNWNGNATQIANKINAGAFYVLHRDHGYAGGTGWHAPNFTTSNLNMLSNGNKLPVVFSVNCHTGEFTLNECFAEKFQRKSNGGAVGVVAASYYSYSGWNDGLSVGMFDAIWSNPGILPAFGSGGMGTVVVPPHANIRKMGDVVNHGLFMMTKTWSSGSTSNEYSYRLFHYFGDPSMPIRTETPESITASHSDSISCSASTYAIQSCSYPNGLATLSIPDQLIGAIQLTNGSGNIPVSAFASNYVLLTISGPEHIPYIDTIWVIPGQLYISHAKSDVTCKGSSTGSAELFLSCGSYPFQVSWSTGDTVQYVENLPAGTYYYSVSDQSGYTYNDSIEINEPSSLLTNNASVKNVSCFYGSDGEIDLGVSGGVSPYSYSWSNGQSTQDISSLSSKEYIVTITDNAGCEIIDTINVDQPDPLLLSVTIGHDSTNTCTGQATVFPTGGTTPYTYLWDDPGAQTTQTAMNLCPGLIKVYVTDSNECVTVKASYVYNVASVSDKEKMDFTIFPNPITDGVLNIVVGSEIYEGIYYFELLDLSGKRVFNASEDVSAGETITLELNSIKAGSYLLKLTNSEEGFSTQLLIKI